MVTVTALREVNLMTEKMKSYNIYKTEAELKHQKKGKRSGCNK
jgi:hypothetical protein